MSGTGTFTGFHRRDVGWILVVLIMVGYKVSPNHLSQLAYTL